MSWLNDLLSWGTKAAEYVKPAAETAWNFAKENPTVAGAGLGLLTGGGTGNYGSNNFRNAALGGAAGWAAGQMFGGTPSQAAAGMAPQVGGSSGSSWSPTSIGNPNAFSTSVSNAVPASGASQYFGAGVGDVGDFAGVGAIGGTARPGSGLMDSAREMLGRAKGFGEKYETPLKVGIQGMAILDKRQRVKDTESMLKGQADQEASVNAENRRLVDDSNAAERAYSTIAPRDAYGNVMNATARKVREAGMEPNQTATQSSSRKRSLSLQGTGLATTAAANAQRQPKLQGYGTPSTSAATRAATYGGNSEADLWADYASLGQTAFGWDDEARKQVKP